MNRQNIISGILVILAILAIATNCFANAPILTPIPEQAAREEYDMPVLEACAIRVDVYGDYYYDLTKVNLFIADAMDNAVGKEHLLVFRSEEQQQKILKVLCDLASVMQAEVLVMEFGDFKNINEAMAIANAVKMMNLEGAKGEIPVARVTFNAAPEAKPTI